MNRNQVTSRSTDWETIAVAVILMVTGFVLLGGDACGILSLDHIQNLWPVSLIVVGVVDWFSNAENHSGMVTNK